MRRILSIYISICAVIISCLIPLQGNAMVANEQVSTGSDRDMIAAPIQEQSLSDTLSEFGSLPSASNRFACAVRSAGTVECWGWNGGGALGVNPSTLTYSATPRTIPGINNAVFVSTGSDFTAGTSSPCALLSSGQVKCWGKNGLGQLGDGTTLDSWIPVVVAGVTSASSLSVGPASACAVIAGGSVRCWGNSYYIGEQNISNAVAVSLGDMVGCAVVQDGRVKCWGTNYMGQLGDGQTSGWPRGPEFVPNVAEATDVKVGRDFACAKLVSASVTCWGMNNSGEPQVATPVTAFESSVSISVGEKACSVTAAGTVFCWDGPGDPVSQKSNIDNAVYVSQSGDRTCVTLTSGVIECWGLLEFPGPDYQNAIVSDIPKVVSGFSGIVITSTNSSIQISASSRRVDSMSVEHRKIDEQIWTAVNCESTCTLQNLTPGTRYVFRYELFDKETSMASFTGVEASTGGTGSFSIRVMDSNGNPVSLGAYSWVSVDGLNKSSSPKTGTVLGGVAFSSVPAKMINISISGGLLSDGSSVTGTFTAQATNGSVTLSIPETPTKLERTVKVQLPSGNPVPGAMVSTTGLSFSAPFQALNFTGLVSLPSKLSGTTDSDGIVPLVGYAVEPVLVQATYDDGELNQSTQPTSLLDGLTTLELDYLPIVSLAKETVVAPVNSIVSIPLSVGEATEPAPARFGQIGRSSIDIRAASTSSYAGVSVSVSPPPGASQTVCKAKTSLSAKTSSSGRAILKVCASVSGEYVIRTKGAVSAGSITIRVSNSKPMQVTSLDSQSLTSGRALVAWGTPRYNGGSSIKSYTITATAPGSKALTKVFTSSSTVFKSRAYNFTGLAPDKRWTFRVTASNKYGSSPSTSTAVLVRGSR